MRIRTARRSLKLLGAAIAVSCLPVLAATPASAAASGDLVATNLTKIDDKLEFIGDTTFAKDGQVYHAKAYGPSGGGEFAACMSSPKPNGGQDYALYEYDEGSNADEYVGKAKLTESKYCLGLENAGKWVDGGNKKAEFYVTTKDSRAKNMKVSYYD